MKKQKPESWWQTNNQKPKSKAVYYSHMVKIASVKVASTLTNNPFFLKDFATFMNNNK